MVYNSDYMNSTECGRSPEEEVTKASILGSDLARIGGLILYTMRNSMGRDRVSLPFVKPEQNLQPEHAEQIMGSMDDHLRIATDLVPSKDMETLGELMFKSRESGIGTFELSPKLLILEGMKTGLFMPWKLAFCSGVPTYADLLEQLSSDSTGVPPILGPLTRLAYGANGSLGSYSSSPSIKNDSKVVAVFSNQKHTKVTQEYRDPDEYRFTYEGGRIIIPREIREFNRESIARKNYALDKVADAGKINGCPVRKGFDNERSLIQMCVEFNHAILKASLSGCRTRRVRRRPL